jgi:hypothetical protein
LIGSAYGISRPLPGPALTEVIRHARARGNVSRPAQIAATLKGQGMVVVHPQDDDLIRCAELLELSVANPGPSGAGTGSTSSLSLADGLILAIVERLGVPVVPRPKPMVDCSRTSTEAVRNAGPMT